MHFDIELYHYRSIILINIGGWSNHQCWSYHSRALSNCNPDSMDDDCRRICRCPITIASASSLTMFWQSLRPVFVILCECRHVVIQRSIQPLPSLFEHVDAALDAPVRLRRFHICQATSHNSRTRRQPLPPAPLDLIWLAVLPSVVGL